MHNMMHIILLSMNHLACLLRSIHLPPGEIAMRQMPASRGPETFTCVRHEGGFLQSQRH